MCFCVICRKVFGMFLKKIYCTLYLRYFSTSCRLLSLDSKMQIKFFFESNDYILTLYAVDY